MDKRKINKLQEQIAKLKKRNDELEIQLYGSKKQREHDAILWGFLSITEEAEHEK